MCIGGGAETQDAGMYESMLAQQAQQEIDYWKRGGFRDLENDAILEAKKQTSDNKTQKARGQAHVAALSQLNKATQQQPTVDPNSGTARQIAAGLNTATGDALARASNDADLLQRQKSRSGLMEMAKFGRGQQSVGIQGLNAAAQFEAGTNAANLALKRSAEDFNAETLGSIGGMVAGYGMDMFKKSPPPSMDNFGTGLQTDYRAPTDAEMRAAEARVGNTLR